MSLRIPYNSSDTTYFYLTLNERYIGTIETGLTYSVQFSKNTSSTTKSAAVYDFSQYPETYNYVGLTTMTGATGSNNVKLDEGWYKYEVYTYADRVTKLNRLELGMCYVYDNANKTQNTPDNTETYIETKDKYVYNRD